MPEVHGILDTSFGAKHRLTTKTIKSLIDLYDAWHEAEPDAAYAAEAAAWRVKLPEENGE